MVGWNRPSLGIVSQGYLGQFLLNLILFTFMIIWQYVSETKSIVKYSKNDLHGLTCIFFEIDDQLMIVIAG